MDKQALQVGYFSGGARIKRLGIILSILPLLLLTIAEAAESEKTEDQASALDKRIRIERRTRYQAFVLTPHRPNYVLPVTYNTRPNNEAIDTAEEGELDQFELKFQFSIKFPIVEKLFEGTGSLQFAYTNLSFWQAYNAAASRPFRETVHEPELFLIFMNDWNLFGMDNRLVRLGMVHQSNGQTGEQSRTWNRVYADFIFQRDDFYLSVKPWYHLKNSDSSMEDNPDIDDYLGHGEIRVAYAGGTHTVSLLVRNYIENHRYGTVEINWSFPMTRRVKWFMQYFNGYGESLIDYNARVNRFGIGVAFTDWL